MWVLDQFVTASGAASSSLSPSSIIEVAVLFSQVAVCAAQVTNNNARAAASGEGDAGVAVETVEVAEKRASGAG